MYCAKLAKTKAMVNVKQDQDNLLDEVYVLKSKGVVIDDVTWSKPKPRKRVKRKASQL